MDVQLHQSSVSCACRRESNITAATVRAASRRASVRIPSHSFPPFQRKAKIQIRRFQISQAELGKWPVLIYSYPNHIRAIQHPAQEISEKSPKQCDTPFEKLDPSLRQTWTIFAPTTRAFPRELTCNLTSLALG